LIAFEFLLSLKSSFLVVVALCQKAKGGKSEPSKNNTDRSQRILVSEMIQEGKWHRKYTSPSGAPVKSLPLITKGQRRSICTDS